MGRKRSGKNAASSPKTELIRVDADLAKKLAVIAQAFGGTISDIVSPLIAATVEKRFAEALEALDRLKKR